jgi:hypothetical protein
MRAGVRSEERRALIAEAVKAVATGAREGCFAILTDADQEENYVQFKKGADRQAVFEVTSRRWGGRLPPLTDQQVAALQRLGFTHTESNLRQETNLEDPEAIARISEQAFAILGSPDTFTLGIELQDLD